MQMFSEADTRKEQAKRVTPCPCFPWFGVPLKSDGIDWNFNPNMWEALIVNVTKMLRIDTFYEQFRIA